MSEPKDNKQETEQETVSEEFVKILKDLVRDILTTFPEVKENIQGSLRRVCCDEGDENDKQEVFKYVGEVLPERFFDILYQNSEIFTDSEVNTCFLPNIDFSELWKCDISDKTRETIWKYLQLLLFSVIGNMSNGDSFKDTAKLFEAIDEGEFKSKLEETVTQMQDLFNFNDQHSDNENEGGEQNDKGLGIDDLPDPEKIHEHVMGMMDGKLGSLAKEIAEETAEEMCLNMEEGSTVNDVFEKLFKNPGKIMNLVKSVGTKLDSKIKDGDLKESELIEEASEMMSKMKDIPGMKDINGMLEKMGMGGLGNLGGKGGKVNMNAFQSYMNANMKQAKAKERMQQKIQKRKMMKQEDSANNSKIEEDMSESIKKADQAMNELLSSEWLHTDSNNNLVFSVGEKAEKTPAKKSVTNNKKNKKKKKKNKK